MLAYLPGTCPKRSGGQIRGTQLKKLKTESMQLQFYTKPDCPLCDEAKVVLQSIGAKTSFVVIEEIDITKNMGLFTKYKHLIPVLELDGQQLFVLHATYWKLMWKLRWHWVRRFIPQIGRRGL